MERIDPQLETIFGELGISQYVETFVEQGFDTWDTILDIQESDLDALGVKLGHRRKLQKRIANTRGVSIEGCLGSPTSTRMGVEDRYDAPRSEGVKSSEVKNGGVTKRKYRRHPKPDVNAPERPPSAYVLFSNKMREDLKGRTLSFTEIAKLVGENWQSLTPSEKEPYERQAQQAKETYNNNLGEYKKTPEYRQYNQYLQEFKLKHAPNSQQGKDSQKRPRLEASLQASLQASNSPHAGSASSSALGGNSSRGNVSGASSGESLQASEPPPSRRILRQESSSESSTPMTFARNADEALISPGSHGSDFFEPMDHSPKSYPHDAPQSSHRSRRSLSWKPHETAPHLPSLSDVFDTSRQPFSQNTPEGSGYSGFLQSHHRSGPGPPGSAQSPGDAHPSLSIGLRKEHSSAGSMSSCSGNTSSGSGSMTSSSGQGPPSSLSSYGRSSNEGSLPLPIHALLASKNKSRFDSPTNPSTPSSGTQQSPPLDRPVYLHRHAASRTSSTMSATGLDYLSAGSGYQSPPQLPGFSTPHAASLLRRDSTAEAAQTRESNSKEEPTGLDGMSALLRAGEIVDRRTR